MRPELREEKLAYLPFRRMPHELYQSDPLRLGLSQEAPRNMCGSTVAVVSQR